MPEQAYTPPETKYEVHIDELMKAIRGEDFVQGKGLLRMTGEDIIRQQLINDFFFLFLIKPKPEQKYVVLNKAKLIGSDALTLENETLTDYDIGFIVHQSMLRDIILSYAIIAGLYSWNSMLGDIKISNYSILGNIYICYNSLSGYIKIYDNGASGNIMIYDNSQSDQILVNNNSLSENIMVENNSQSDLIRVYDNSRSGDIRVSDKSQSGQITIYHNSQSGDIRIDHNSQSGDIGVLDKSQSGNISVDKNTKTLAISIADNSQTGNLDFTNAMLSNISIEQNYFAISFYNTQFLLMTINQSLLTTLAWQAGTKGELYISQSRVLHLQVANTSLLKDSVLSLSDTQLQYAILQEVLVQGSLLLRKLSPPLQPFEWRNVPEYVEEEPIGYLKKIIWNVKKEFLEAQAKEYDKKATELATRYGTNPLFRISHSSMGKTEITGCDFSGFQFQYYNSNLLGCFITGTQLPKRNMVIYDPVTDKVLNNQSHSNSLFEQKTAVYNQFKKIYENQGDVVEASVFHAQAMHWQQKLLWRQFRHDKEGFWKKVKLFFENIGFRLNWFSNNHGESWLVALVFTIGVGLVFFTASIWGLTHWGDFKTLNDHIHKLPGFMLPIHKLDFLSEDIIKANPALKVNLWHTSWDLLGRIFIGYGIFQFISAFRRHGKKGG